MAFVRAMYKKGAGNDKQGKDAGNRTLCPYRNFSQAITQSINFFTFGSLALVLGTSVIIYQPAYCYAESTYEIGL